MFTELDTQYGNSYFLHEGYYRSRPYDVSSIGVFMRNLLLAGVPEASMERRKDTYLGFQVLFIQQSPEVDAIFTKLLQEKHNRIQRQYAYYAEKMREWEANKPNYADYDDLP